MKGTIRWGGSKTCIVKIIGWHFDPNSVNRPTDWPNILRHLCVDLHFRKRNYFGRGRPFAPFPVGRFDRQNCISDSIASSWCSTPLEIRFTYFGFMLRSDEATPMTSQGRRCYSMGGLFRALCLSSALCIVAKRCKIGLISVYRSRIRMWGRDFDWYYFRPSRSTLNPK